MTKKKILKYLETTFEFHKLHYIAKKNEETMVELPNGSLMNVNKYICASDVFQAFIELEMFKNNFTGYKKYKLMRLYRIGYQTINSLSSIYNIKNIKDILNDYDIEFINLLLDFKYEYILYFL
ncbi:hypothetical protein FZJ52_09030, partial [Campylobacter jejuni]|nr:hypothetical protein [Campylobacter jejuni]